MAAFKDITGKRYGRLLAVKPYSQDKHFRWKWEFVCDCGRSVVLPANSVRTGNTKSCGCFRSDYMRSVKTEHGKSKSSTYEVWCNMKRRCTDTTNKAWHNYGGRGIKICDRWQSFENFLADMGERPDNMTLERNDNDGTYEPSNCRWATRTEQLRNQQKTIKVTWNGETLCLSEWARKCGISSESMRRRYKLGELPPRLLRPKDNHLLFLRPGRKPRRLSAPVKRS